jgi:hypothetical protein
MLLRLYVTYFVRNVKHYNFVRKVLYPPHIFHIPKTAGIFRDASLHTMRIFSDVGRIFVLGGSQSHTCQSRPKFNYTSDHRDNMVASVNSRMPKVSYVKAIDIYFLVSFGFVFSTLLQYILLLTLKHQTHLRKLRKVSPEYPLSGKVSATIITSSDISRQF